MNLTFRTDRTEAEHPATMVVAVFVLTFLAFWFMTDRDLIVALVIVGGAAACWLIKKGICGT
jgi:hypothetical protein